MKKRFLIMLGIVLLVLPIVAADMDKIGPFKQNTDIELWITCSNCTSNNITSVLLPNSTVLATGLEMTKIGTRYNHSLNSDNTSTTGKYIVNGEGDLDADITVWSYTFDVNPTGIIQTSIFNNPMLIILGLLGLIFVVFGVAKSIPWFGFIGSIMFLLLGIYTMIYGFNNVTDMYTRGVSIAILGIGMIFMFTSAYEWVYD